MLAWLYWNPDRIIFKLPIIDRPIAWYGFFFVIGFVIGYFFMVKMTTLILQQTQILALRDIKNWPLLQEQLQKIDSNIGTDKEKILNFLNTELMMPEGKWNRKNIDQYFPGSIYSLKELAQFYTDKLVIFTMVGTIVGARLGHVFFYDWPLYQNNLWDILKVWEGGLASHGGTIGVLVCVFLFFKYYRRMFPEISFLNLLDNMCVPTALVGFFIRIGNFVNQEILGTPTTVPWAIIFGDPMDSVGVYPRHPVQLYEASCYLLTFFLLTYLWFKKRENFRQGFFIGLFFILIFGSRFLLEYFKVPMGAILSESFLQMGQMLSIPFIILGFWLIYPKKMKVIL